MRKKHVRNLTAGCAAFMAAAFVFSAGFSKTAFAESILNRLTRSASNNII